MIDEFSFIEFLKREFEGGLIGDDCAIYKNFLISLDQMVEGVHFLFSRFPPFYLGKKAVYSTLSDIAAMGGIPYLIFLGLTLRKDIPFKWVKEFFDGVKEAINEYGVALAGGDLSRGETITISLTVIGNVNKSGILRRNGAKARDLILCTVGEGCAKVGLEKLYSENFDEKFLSDVDVLKFLIPLPQIEVGKFLVEIGVVSSCIDVSDGILRDLKNLCRESNLSSLIFLEKVEEIASFKNVTVDDFLKSGEEYELLFSVGEKELPYFLDEFGKKFPEKKVAVIGKFVEKKEKYLYFINCEGKRFEISGDGYDHFGGSA